jgi:hypothetical protein
MSAPLRLQAGDGMAIWVPVYGEWLHFFNGVPTNGATGFMPNALGVNLQAAAGDTNWYINTGTFASATWTAMPLTELATLAGLTATAAEISRDCHAASRVVLLPGSTSITTALHEGRDLLLTGTGSAFTQTLPAATGSGGRFYFEVGAVNTSNHIIQSASSADLFTGFINLVITASATTKSFAANGSSNYIATFNGTTTGGSNIGGQVEFIDVAANQWLVNGTLMGSGALATPFSG